ncbi:MAG: hypothetical protein ACOWWM_04765 [Desulfobacterales bacterium]
MSFTDSNQLPCGCVIGKQICPDAEALWQKAKTAYREAVANQDPARRKTLWQRYTEAICAYDSHMNLQCKRNLMKRYGISDGYYGT